MADLEDFRKVITEIIQKQMVILGPDVALLTARKVEGLQSDNDGVVSSLDGEPGFLLQKLVNEYATLSELSIKRVLEPLVQKYPRQLNGLTPVPK